MATQITSFNEGRPAPAAESTNRLSDLGSSSRFNEGRPAPAAESTREELYAIYQSASMKGGRRRPPNGRSISSPTKPPRFNEGRPAPAAECQTCCGRPALSRSFNEGRPAPAAEWILWIDLETTGVASMKGGRRRPPNATVGAEPEPYGELQ